MNAVESNRLAVTSDTAIIEQVIRRARIRIRVQGAFEGAVTAVILATVVALATVFAMRTEMVSTLTGLITLCFLQPIVIAGALIGAFKRLDDEAVARRIDRASNLADRLSTAIAFRRTMADTRSTPAEAETTALMAAAIRDAVKATPRANIKAATPFTMPKDLKAALGFLVVSALAAGLAIPPVDRAPHVFGATPDHGLRGSEVVLNGKNLMTGVSSPVASADPARAVIGSPGAVAGTKPTGFVPGDASVFLGAVGSGRPIEVLDWKRETIRVRIPTDAPFGDTLLTVFIGGDAIGTGVAFTVVDPKDVTFHADDSVLLDADERAYIESIIAQLKDLAKREKIEDLDKFVAKIEQLLRDAELGKVTKEQLLAELAKAEQMLKEGKEPNQAELAKKLADMGKEFQKSELTKQLGKALEHNELDKAKQELEELARKLEKSQLESQLEKLENRLKDPKLTEQQKRDIQNQIDKLKQEMAKDLEELKNQLDDPKLSEQDKKDLQKKIDEMKHEKPLTEKQKDELQKQLENVTKQMDKRDKQDQKQQSEQQQKLEDQIRRLQKDKDNAKTEQDKLDAERKLQKKKDELQKLQKDNEQKNQSAQREAVKRLQRDMEKAAEQLQKPNKQDSQDDKNDRERQASQKLKDAARETGKVDQDQRKQAQQKKMASQMEELREALARAKQKGNKGQNDPFGKQAKNSDFGKRSRGQKGSGQAWKPGQGQGQGQGQPGGQQPGGQGNQPGGKQWGVGHDDNLTDNPTDKTGNTKDVDLTGKTGANGTSRRETILAAAQKGFSSTSYKKVYQHYNDIVEEVMRNEKLPASYKYYVKRYFAKIHPSGSPDSGESAPAPAPQGGIR